MSKSELRNFLKEYYKDDPTICIPAESYAIQKPEVTLVDALTRLHHIAKPSVTFTGNEFRTSVVRDGGYFVSLVAESFDFYFQRGSSVLVWLIDKSGYIPMTKGVEQRRRVDDTNADIQDLDHPDQEIQEAAQERLLQLSRTWPGMSAEAKKHAMKIRKKLDDRETKLKKIQDTKERLTILEIDNMRVCWDRLPIRKKREIISEAKELGIRIFWKRGEEYVHEQPVDAFSDDCILDDYQLEAVLLSTARNMMLPEPWEVFIKKSRPKIIRYILRSLLHGYYDAYTPQIGARLFIDGHDYPGWRIAKQQTFTFGDMDDKTKPLSVETVTLDESGNATVQKKSKSIAQPYVNFSPMLLMHPEDHRWDLKENSDDPASMNEDPENVYKLQQATLKNPRGFLQNSKRGTIPNCLQPKWRYAKDYGHKVGESDFSIFHWIEKLRFKPGKPGPDNYKTFEIVSTDTDVLYLAMLYLNKLRQQEQESKDRTHEPQLMIIMEAGWFAHRKLIFNVNKLLDAVIADHLKGVPELLPNFIYAFYASAGDYTIGYKYAPPKAFIKAYLEHFDYIGYIVKMTKLNGREVPVLNARAYRRLLSAAYFVSHQKTILSKTDITCVDDIGDISRLRRLLNPHLVKKEYHQYFCEKNPCQALISIPEYKGDATTPDELEAKRKIEKRFDLMVTNIQKKIPHDQEIMNRGLLLQNFICMCHQVGTDELELCDPTAFGYQSIDPEKPISRSNIEFSASYNYEIEEFFVNTAEAMDVE